MRVREAQSLGMLLMLVTSLIVYGAVSLVNGLHQSPTTPPPWVNQELGMIVVEVTGSKGADGIYFLPQKTSIAETLKAVGVAGEIDPPGESFSQEINYTIIVEGRWLKIRDMSVVRKLALGLPIDVNRASVDDLSMVPGIGKMLAVQIVELRQIRNKFVSLDDLTTVRGIKEKKLTILKKHLTVKSP
jgi:competence protein ComEA